MSWLDDIKKAAGETVDSVVGTVSEAAESVASTVSETVDSLKEQVERVPEAFDAAVKVGKIRQESHFDLLFRPVYKTLLPETAGAVPDENEFYRITEGYSQNDRPDGVPFGTGMTKVEIVDRVRLLKAQDAAAALNEEGLDLGDVAGFAAGVITPSPIDLATYVVQGGPQWGWASRAVFEVSASVAAEAVAEHMQGHTYSLQEIRDQALLGVGFVSATQLGVAAIKGGAAGLKKTVAEAAVPTKTPNTVDPARHASLLDEDQPLGPAETRGATISLMSGGNIPLDEATAVAQKQFDALEMRMPKEAPTPVVAEPPKPKPEKVLVVPEKFQSNHIQAGAGIVVPDEQTDRWVLRFATAGAKEKGGILTRARDGVKGFDPKNPAHVNELKNLSLDAERGIVRGLSDAEKVVANKPQFAKRLENMNLWEELQARIDYLNLRENANPDGVPRWMREDKVPYADASKTVTEKLNAPVGDGVVPPTESVALSKLNKGLREIANRMNNGKQFGAVIKDLLSDPDTADLPPGARRKLMALRDLMGDKLGPDEQGLINSKALHTILDIVQAYGDTVKRRLSRTASSNAYDQVIESARVQSFGDLHDRYTQYLKDKDAYAKAKADHDASVAQGKKLADGGDLPEPMPPEFPIAPKDFLEAAQKQMAAVTSMFGKMPFWGDPSTGLVPWKGMGAKQLWNPELRASITGVGDLNAAIEHGQRKAMATFLNAVSQLDQGSISTITHFFRGMSKEEQRLAHEAMFNGGSTNKAYDGLVKVWSNWWGTASKELASVGLPAGTLTSYAIQDLDKTLVVGVGFDAFVDAVEPHVKGGRKAAEALYRAIEQEPHISPYAKTRQTMLSRQFEFNDADGAWSVLQKFSGKDYGQMMIDRMMDIEGTLASAKLVGPDPIATLRAVVSEASATAKEAWNRASPKDRKGYMTPAEIDKWEEAVSGKKYGGTRVGGVIGEMYGELQNTSAHTAIRVAEHLQGAMTGMMTSASAAYFPIDLARNYMFMLNQMPKGGKYNPTNWVGPGIDMYRTLRYSFDNFQNPFSGKRASKSDFADQAEYLGMTIELARFHQSKFYGRQDGMGGTMIQDATDKAGRALTKTSRALASTLAQAQGLPQSNFALRIANTETFMMNMGDQIFASGGDLNVLKNGGMNAYNMYIKFRQAGFDNSMFKRLHDVMTKNNLLIDAKKQGWMRRSHKIADVANLYSHDPKMSNLLDNMIEANFNGGVADSDAWHRLIRRRGGAYVSKFFGDMQQGTTQGLIANSTASMTNVLVKTANDFTHESFINGPGHALPAIAPLLAASTVGYAVWSMARGDITPEELERDPYMLFATPYHVGRIIDNSGYFAQMGYVFTGMGLYNSSYIENVNITGSGKAIQGPLEFMANYSASQALDKPMFQFAADTANTVLGTASMAEFAGTEAAVELPKFSEQVAAASRVMVPNPFVMQLMGVNLQDYYLSAVSPTLAARQASKKKTRMGIINQGRFSGLPDWLKPEPEGD